MHLSRDPTTTHIDMSTIPKRALRESQLGVAPAAAVHAKKVGALLAFHWSARASVVLGAGMPMVRAMERDQSLPWLAV